MRIPKLRSVVFFGSLILAFAILFTLGSFEVTSKPVFCGSCHIMHPYYESWKTSSHNQIACVECHIPPGIESELRKKYEAISMVARYFTGTYGTHPWAEVDDVSCLRCHERRLVAGRETFQGIQFNHTPHLTEMPRGKRLRCTSCHSQIVQGKHIAVTTSTCFLCHFKNRNLGEGTADCQLCHGIPEKTVQRASFSFNHSDVRQFDMKCDWCHADVVMGEGDVPENRCLSCHNEAVRLKKYEHTEELHRIHVTEHTVECLHCHNEIQHGSSLKQVHQTKSSCENCHETGHSAQEALYTGVGGKGIDRMPNPMFQAGVRCEGCHFMERTGHAGGIKLASGVSCMACHGAHYAKIYDGWRAITSDRLGKARQYLDSTQDRLTSPYPQPFLDARANIEFVERAIPIHNVDYSLALLDKSVALLNTALKQTGKNTGTLPWQPVPFSSRCLSCHQGIETQSAQYGRRPFSHQPHVLKNELDCELCHVPHEIPPKTQPQIISDSECGSCHHDQSFANACVKCHNEEVTRLVPVRGQVLDRKGLKFDHTMHLEATQLKCVDCHFSKSDFRRTPEAKLCEGCHG